MTDELIRDQLIVQCRDKKIQERLWAAKDPTLQEEIDLAKVLEESRCCIKELERKEKTVDVMALSNNSTRSQSETGTAPKKGGFIRSKGRECFQCGSTSHLGDSKKCFAANKECRKCCHRGHYACVCRESNRCAKESKSSINIVEECCESSCEDRILVVENDVTMYVNGGDRRCSRPSALFFVGEVQVNLMVDSASLYTMIPESLLKRHWRKEKLLPKDKSPGGYQGVEIQLLGYMLKEIRFGKRKVLGKIYVAVEGSPILGWMHQFDLNIVISPRASVKFCW
ncbi:hypothetical protein NDU88_005303 [Pleurodeles waltl]|uniref:Uncharacterized protein n=1 Tax=Pleurodeles waltl TaxID=8319 RepID=A0AAV7SLF1_PLEWA|nr:hypothetical protein NDU88_005303 [Pleurodeles waltl]